MDISANQIEAIVRQVVASMGTGSAPKAAGPLPKVAKVAMLVGPKKIEIQEVPLPELGEDDILIKVEGAGICGTDVHEWKMDPFGLMPVVLGHEGTGEVVYCGKNITKDTAGKPIGVGDKIVTSVISCGDCYNCRMTPGRTNLCANQGVFGLIGDKRGTDEGNRANGWFADYMLIRGGEASGATFFQVNELNLNQRMILELACVCVHALERGQKTGLLNFGSKVLVQGCGPVGLVMITVLRAAGINHIIAVDGNEDRLKVAQKMGAKTTVCFKRPDEDTLDKRVAKVQAVANGVGVDFAFQCTGAPVAAADIYAYIRRGGGMCEMGFFVNNGEYSVNPHFAMCNKEIDIVGSWDYSAEDYPKTVAFLKQCQEMNIPIEDLITHTYPLDQMNEAMETNVAQKGIKIAYIAK
ncbi:MAG: alcohol dehydrogenase catalytic domain-containing protein [Clostridia bacterium]|nr:alcohol dehydrogenase catalytic domain-containing protein [Clostridia bacterium]